MAVKGWQIALMVLTIIVAIVLAYRYRKNSYYEPAPPAVPTPPPPAVPPAMPPPPAPPAMPEATPAPDTMPPPTIPPSIATLLPNPTEMPQGTQTSMMPPTLSEFDTDISGFNKEDLSYDYTAPAPDQPPPPPTEQQQSTGVETYTRSPYAEF